MQGLRFAIATGALAAVGLSSAAAQFGQPVYPGYQGFIDNPDGSVTMVFQYFSHGRDPVELPPGPSNHFTGEEDRGQVTTFEPGNHEFTCVLVMPDREAAQELRWTLAFPEEAVSTSLDPLHPEYMLEENSAHEAQRGLDLESAPRGRCINKAPAIRPTARFRPASQAGQIQEVEAQVGAELALQGRVTDEGLPRGSRVTSEWRLLEGPGEATFDDPSKPETTVTFATEGTYLLELHASDGELDNSEKLRVQVGAG